MPRLRGPVLLAWIFCAVISAMSLFGAARSLIQIETPGQPLMLAGTLVFALIPMVFAIPAALIITRQPHNVIGWLLMVNPLVEIPTGAVALYFSRFQSAPPATFLNLLMLLILGLSWMALIFPILLVPLFFPTGRLISPRWRWTVYLAVGMVLFLIVWAGLTRVYSSDNIPWTLTNPVGFITEEETQVILPPWSILLAVLTAASLVSVIVRYRRASLVERVQMKWLLYACALFGAVYIPGVISNSNNNVWTATGLLDLLFGLSIMAIPAAITIAILRYHLFDIDVIIRLTLVYLIVTGMLGLLYLGGIILLQQAFRALTGQASSAAVVITTLAIAALFNPLRQRIQAAIDRRFFRQKYDAEQALARFAVAARGSADLDALTVMLVEITQSTLQPTHINLHLKTGKEGKET